MLRSQQQMLPWHFPKNYYYYIGIVHQSNQVLHINFKLNLKHLFQNFANFSLSLCFFYLSSPNFNKRWLGSCKSHQFTRLSFLISVFLCNKLFLGTNIVNIELCAATQIQPWTTDHGDYVLKRYYTSHSLTHTVADRTEQTILFTWSSILNAIHCLSNGNLNWKYSELGSYSGADILVFIFNGHKPPKCTNYSCHAMHTLSGDGETI